MIIVFLSNVVSPFDIVFMSILLTLPIMHNIVFVLFKYDWEKRVGVWYLFQYALQYLIFLIIASINTGYVFIYIIAFSTVHIVLELTISRIINCNYESLDKKYYLYILTTLTLAIAISLGTYFLNVSLL
jgi:hypothetical protein